MKALRFTVHLDVWPARKKEGAAAAQRLRQLADYFETLPPGVFEHIPTGGITGEPSESGHGPVEFYLLNFVEGVLSGRILLENSWKATWKVEERK